MMEGMVLHPCLAFWFCFGLSCKVFREKSIKRDNARNKQMKCKSSDVGKKRRKRLRTIKKGFPDKEKEVEKTDSYIPGGF